MVKERTDSCVLLAVNQLPPHTEVKFIKKQAMVCVVRGIDRPFRGGVKSILEARIFLNLFLRAFFTRSAKKL
jgi:hypothetical protein